MRPVVGWATTVVGCRMGVDCPFPDDVFCAGGYGDESLLLLSFCEVGVDVVEDVGRVRVQASAREGLR